MTNPYPRTRNAMAVAGFMLAWLAGPGGALHTGRAAEPTVEVDRTDASLATQVRELREQKKLVSLAALVMVDGQVVASAADGKRKVGSDVAVTVADQWHIGSITKSITATMIARLVEQSQMQWTDTVGQYFQDETVHADWKPVTLRQLLTHTSGAPANFSLQVRLKRPEPGDETTAARKEAVLEELAKKPQHPAGEKFAYSNIGYTIAGAMAEAATGTAWEELVRREVFQPLKLQGAGFGAPTSPLKTLDQPRGHRTALGIKTSVNDKADNTPIMGPAGTAHMTLQDLATYTTEHLRGHQGQGTLLSQETYHTLHTPELENYACGWVRREPNDEIPHTVYWHNGSNTMWYALTVFVPEQNLVVTVASNDGDVPSAESAAWKIVKTVTARQ